MQINNVGRSLSDTPPKALCQQEELLSQILGAKSVYWVPYLNFGVMDISPTKTQDVSLSMRKKE